ncbi:hypothetical protein, partial [Mediterraneibacter gnavus]|uniref:hypothetical protein n=1 Tax=Mediterraneibacter gnavus TaxID=33038 RepID=UPI0034A51A3C
MLAFSNDYYGFIFRATQSVELFCAYGLSCLRVYHTFHLISTNFLSPHSTQKGRLQRPHE